MGLAASQGRMILLVQNRINCQYKLMDLSNQQLRNLDEQDLIADKYDQMATAAIYSYQYNDDIKLEDFTYSDLMGKNAVASGREAIMITDTMGRVVLDDRYGAAITAAKNTNGGKLQANETCFNAFVGALEDNNENWYRLRNSRVNNNNNNRGSQNSNPSVNTTDKKIDAPVGSVEYTKWSDLCANIRSYGNEFINKYGKDMPYHHFEADASALEYQTEPNPLVNDLDSNLVDDIGNRNHRPLLRDKQTEMSGHWVDKPNSKGKWYDEWNTALEKAASEAGVDKHTMSSYVQWGVLPSRPKIDNPNYGKPQEPETPSTPSIGNTEEQAKINKAKFYWSIFERCVSKGYVEDPSISDRTTLNAKLYNGTYNINGNNIRNDKNATFKKARDNADEYEEIKNQEKKELAKLEREEKRISSEKEKAQTQLSAIETEINSVQSIITKNIERGFTYCQNG